MGYGGDHTATLKRSGSVFQNDGVCRSGFARLQRHHSTGVRSLQTLIRLKIFARRAKQHRLSLVAGLGAAGDRREDGGHGRASSPVPQGAQVRGLLTQLVPGQSYRVDYQSRLHGTGMLASAGPAVTAPF